MENNQVFLKVCALTEDLNNGQYGMAAVDRIGQDYMFRLQGWEVQGNYIHVNDCILVEYGNIVYNAKEPGMAASVRKLEEVKVLGNKGTP
jgi:hypothetical protein